MSPSLQSARGWEAILQAPALPCSPGQPACDCGVGKKRHFRQAPGSANHRLKRYRPAPHVITRSQKNFRPCRTSLPSELDGRREADASAERDACVAADGEDLIGPALPPGFKAHGTVEDEERDPSPVAGPALPPNYKSSSSDSSDSDEDSSSLSEEGNQESEDDDTGPTARKQRRNQDSDDDDGFFGPALPPGFKKQDDSPPRPIIGPALPPGFIKSTQKSDKGREDPGQVSSYFNSEEMDSSEEEDIVGPMPAKGPVNYSITTEFEKRAQRMKEKLTRGDDDSSKPIMRESWMTELPPEMKDFGLGPRTFKRRADDKSGDRSVWTDTPADRERKAKEIQEAKKSLSKKEEECVLSGRDKRLAEQVSSYNESKRSESLMDIHHKKLKNKAADDKNKPQERTPFDRDKDLKVNRFDEAQKKP